MAGSISYSSNSVVLKTFTRIHMQKTEGSQRKRVRILRTPSIHNKNKKPVKLSLDFGVCRYPDSNRD